LKSKSFEGYCDRLNIDARYRIRGLQTQSGRQYLCTKTQRKNKNSSGKLRYALDKHGTFLVVKEVRTETAFARAMAQRKPLQTMLTPRAAICREVALLQTIEPKLRVHDFIEVDGKAFVIMDAMLGDFGDLIGDPLSARRYLVRTMLAQVARSLQRCHDAGYIHHDVKVENILWRDNFEMVLADYGSSLPFDEVQKHPKPVSHLLPVNYMQLRELGPPGTYPAPEMCVLQLHDNSFCYDHRIDMWALGMTCVVSYVRWDNWPFRRWRLWTDTGDYDRVHKDIQSYTLWHQEVVQDDGRLSAQRLFAPRHPADTQRAWDRCFRRLYETDPKLTAFVLRYLLHPQPHKRASLQDIEKFCQKLADSCSEQDVAASRALLAAKTRKSERASAYAKYALNEVSYAATQANRPTRQART
jgi:serine/threonine protein kinase